MAKLAALNYGGAPQSLGREDINLPAQVAASKAGIATSVAGAVQEGMDLWDQETQRQADVNVANRMLDFEAAHKGKSFYSGDELPDDVPEAMRFKEVDGELVPRENIPAYQVFPMLLDKQQNLVLDEESQGIINPRSRETWMGDKSLTAKQRMVETLATARSQQSAQIQAAQLFDINTAMDNGRWGLAAQMVREFTGPELEKKEMVETLLDRQESAVLNQLMIDEDTAGMRDAINNLKEEKTNLPPEKAKVFASQMRSEIKRLEDNDKAAVIAAAADKIVDHQIAVGGTEQEMLARIRGDESIGQERKDEAIRRTKVRFAEEKRGDALALRAKTDSIWTQQYEAPSMDLITPDLPSATANAMREFVLKRAQGPIQTDTAVYYEIYQQMDQDFDTFKKRDLNNDRSKLAAQEFKELVRLQSKDATDPDIREGQSLTRQVDNALVGMDINPRPKVKTGKVAKKVAAIRTAIDAELSLEAEAKGRRLAPTERQAVIDRISIQMARDKWFGLSQDQLGVDDLPPEAISQLPFLIEALRYKGLPVNGAEIYRMWERRKTMGDKKSKAAPAAFKIDMQQMVPPT